MLILICVYTLIRSSLCNDPRDSLSLDNLTTISSLEYLGCGYNLLYNKKKIERTDNDDEIDTNYKNPVVKFNFSGDLSNINNTLQYLHPDGTFIYNSPNCSIKQESKLEKNLNKKEHMLSSEVSVDVISAKADASIDNSNENKSYKNKLEKTIYCSVYIAGINQAHHIEYTKDFIRAILNLKDGLAAEKRRGCTTKSYKRNVCSNARQLWSNFLNSYGTHYISKIVLGGKIVYNQDEGSNSDANSKSANLNLSLTGVDIKNINDKNKSSNKDAKNLTTNIYGGITYDNNKNWFNELRNDPVPIKVILTSFKDIFHKYGIFNEYIKFLKIH